MTYSEFIGGISKRLGKSIVGFIIVGIGVVIYAISNPNFNEPNFLMLLSFIIGLFGASLVIYSIADSKFLLSL